MKFLTVAVVAILFSSLQAEETMQIETGKVTAITAENYSAEVDKGNVVLDVYATWCKPCERMKPVFEAVSAEFPDVKFAKLDTDQAKEISKSLGVSSLPTFLFMKDGKEVDRQVGSTDAEGLKAKIKKNFG